MKLRVEKTVKTYYTCVLDEEQSQQVIENAEKKQISFEDSLQDLVDNDLTFDMPYMFDFDEDEWFNYVDEEYEDSILPKGDN